MLVWPGVEFDYFSLTEQRKLESSDARERNGEMDPYGFIVIKIQGKMEN